MNVPAIIDRLDRMHTTLPALVANIPDNEARWKPPSGAWSILEIVRHLVDEGTLDFRTRVRLTLTDPALKWPPIDPPRLAIEKRYNDDPEWPLSRAAAEFAVLRRESVAWLRSLHDPNWNSAHHHPKFGPLHAGMLLASWAAHDALHIRQIAKRLHELTSHDAPEYSTAYAGDWTA